MSVKSSQLSETNSDNSQQPSSSTETDESSLTWKIFNAFTSSSDFSATEEELIKYIRNDLKIDISELHPFFIAQLPVIMVTFMNTWSGWLYKTEYLAGKFKKQHYFNRFQKYMSHKMKVLCNINLVKSVMKSLSLKESDCKGNTLKLNIKSSGKNTDVAAAKNPEFFPYAVSIQCPPYMLNTIVFSNVGDDIIMKQHLGSNWKELSTAQLLNWPNIEVSFRTQDICFVRRQATDYVRYLNFLPHECKKIDNNIIEQMESLHNVKNNRLCYTYRFLEEYLKEYVQSLKTIKNITGQKLEEIQTILSQFLEDVRYINVNNSIATNTVVLFRLSQVPFIRNKKLVKNTEKEEDARVGYCEIITPKVELVLLFFRAKQNDTPYISFDYTDKIKRTTISNDLSSILPYIAYKCTFCRVEYNTGNTKERILTHLKHEHKMEQHVRCTVCKKQFDVLNLAACRWRHKCVVPTTPVTIL